MSDEEGALIAPYLTCCRRTLGSGSIPCARRRRPASYQKIGAMPHDLPPWAAVYQQAQRWLAARCFETLLDDLRAVLREAPGCSAEPSAVIMDARTLRSSPESGERAGYSKPPTG